jgi:hypothetical protein
MHNYNYHKTLEDVWHKAVKLFKKGNKDGSTYFNKDEMGFLASIGASGQEIFDFVEAFVTTSQKMLDPDSLPDKDSSAKGIRWLPRIIPKAKAKLRGELHPDVMYCCGGDRRFLRENDIHPAEFLRIVWQNEDDDKAIINWVVKRVKG